MALAGRQRDIFGLFVGFIFHGLVLGLGRRGTSTRLRRQMGGFSSVKPNNESVDLATLFFYPEFIRVLHHTSTAAITLAGVLHALADPVRLAFVRVLLTETGGINCVDTMTKADLVMPKSTCSLHFQILRKAGVVFSRRRGVELINFLRRDDLETRFPGLLGSILAAHEAEAMR